MKVRPVIGIALITAVISTWSMAEENSGKETVRKEETTSGVILEYKQESADKPETVQIKEEGPASAETGTSVEFIVGGQAEDGVAKRKEIPVRK